ncbi:hypothetical protein ACFYTQ_36775 [Nocardia sp. NPDC004068]|uniref:hypothetical protein n=1 Tax=Nocardia sp. NPDC004068 TaxID=3364303 RepID=UPI003683C9ED
MTGQDPSFGDNAHIEHLAEAKVVLEDLRTFVAGQLDHADSLLVRAQQDWRGMSAEAYSGLHVGWRIAAAQLNQDLERIFGAVLFELANYNKKTDGTTNE